MTADMSVAAKYGDGKKKKTTAVEQQVTTGDRNMVLQFWF